MHTVYNNISRWDVVENKSAKLFVLVKYTTSTETRVVAAKFFFVCHQWGCKVHISCILIMLTIQFFS
jgi:hypothetical protein